MAGKVQHEIPRLFQRGFLIPDTGSAGRVFTFRRSGDIFPQNIDKAGAESFFYSSSSPDGQRTLDDEITIYEGRLAMLVKQLRSLPIEASPDPEVAAEVIAHLTTRNAHIRGTISQAMEKVATAVFTVLGDEENVRRLMGIDGPIITDVFRKWVAEALKENPIAALQPRTALLEQLLFAVVREGFPALFERRLSINGLVYANIAVTVHTPRAGLWA